MTDNNNQEKNNQEVLILDLKRLCDQYRHLYRGVRSNLSIDMPDVYECLQSYEQAKRIIQDETTPYVVVSGCMALPMFITIMHEYGFTINGIYNYFFGFFVANLVGYGVNLIFDKRARKALKETIDSIKYVKDHQQEYKIAKEKVKQYKEEIVPKRKKQLDETNDLLVQQLELIKKTTNLIPDDKKCCDEQGECNFSLLYGILDNHNPSQEESPKTISKVKILLGTQTNFKVRKLTKKSTEV